MFTSPSENCPVVGMGESGPDTGFVYPFFPDLEVIFLQNGGIIPSSEAFFTPERERLYVATFGWPIVRKI
jgi:hypothetical protein